jgi:hypothetical protein
MKLKIKRLVLSLVGGGLGVLLLVVGLRSATSLVLADDTGSAGASQADMTPIAAGLDAAPQVVFDWRTVLLDVYDGTYADTYSIPRTITHAGAVPYQWGRTITGTQGFTDTLWCVQGGEGASLHAGVDAYPDGVNTTVTYGPIDLSFVDTAELQFSHWISVASGDGLQLGVSTDGASFSFLNILPGATGTWESTTLNTDVFAGLRPLLGQRTVYLAFRFTSNKDGQVGQGVFLDNVRLRTKTHVDVYLPLMFTPLRIYQDNFSDPTSGWPREWERKKGGENNRGGYMVDRSRAQVLAELMQNAGPQAMDLEFNAWFLGLDDDVYYSVVHDAWDQVFISGPYRAEGDFVFEAKGRYDYVQESYRGNRYGILVSREKVDPRDPHSVHGHCIYVEINPRSDGGFDSAGWGVKEWYRTNWRGDDDGDEDDTVKGPGTDGSIKSKRGSWNQFRIERQGAKLRFWINDVYFGSVDNTDTGPLYVGLFARHTGSGSTELSYDVLFEWDDVKVTPRN